MEELEENMEKIWRFVWGESEFHGDVEDGCCNEQDNVVDRLLGDNQFASLKSG